jgi:hypothetical protein
VVFVVQQEQLLFCFFSMRGRGTNGLGWGPNGLDVRALLRRLLICPRSAPTRCEVLLPQPYVLPSESKPPPPNRCCRWSTGRRCRQPSVSRLPGARFRYLSLFPYSCYECGCYWHEIARFIYLGCWDRGLPIPLSCRTSYSRATYSVQASVFLGHRIILIVVSCLFSWALVYPRILSYFSVSLCYTILNFR